MKQYFISIGFVFILSSAASAQQQVRMITPEQRTVEVSAKIILHKKDTARMQLYKFYSNYFVANNIYPNADAIDLVDAYNKQASYEDIQAKRVDFKALMLPALTVQQMNYKKKQYSVLKARRVNTDDPFKKSAEAFVQKLNAMPGIPAAFKDSLQIFGNRILPGIMGQSNKIPPLQMEFFLTSLTDINHFLDELAKEDDANTRMTIRELMDDFFAYALPVKKSNIMHHPTAFNQTTSDIFSYASYLDPGNWRNESPDDENELPNANVYVYTRGEDGKWSQAPKPDAFNVYYGANGLQYSLKPGCDTLSFFKFHPTAPASTLPVILPKGNVCFVLQDINTKKLTVKPGINLRDNKEVDDKQLIIICFKVEN